MFNLLTYKHVSTYIWCNCNTKVPQATVCKIKNAQKGLNWLVTLFWLTSCRVSSEIEHFKTGLNNVGGLWNKVHLYPKEFQSLFTVVPMALSRAIFKSLYTIQWSPEGSNKKSEEETIYCWELYQKHIEGICNKIL